MVVMQITSYIFINMETVRKCSSCFRSAPCSANVNNLIVILDFCASKGNGHFPITGVCNKYIRCSSFLFGGRPRYVVQTLTCEPGQSFGGLRSVNANPCVSDSTCRVVLGKNHVS